MNCSLYFIKKKHANKHTKKKHYSHIYLSLSFPQKKIKIKVLKTEENSNQSCNVTVKREEINELPTDNFVQQQIGRQTTETISGSGGINIQPLPSNVMNKQSGGMEYMQQQSQIFVFSTALANKGAENVINNHYSSIIAYHCAQPGTKKFLDVRNCVIFSISSFFFCCK